MYTCLSNSNCFFIIWFISWANIFQHWYGIPQKIHPLRLDKIGCVFFFFFVTAFSRPLQSIIKVMEVVIFTLCYPLMKESTQKWQSSINISIADEWIGIFCVLYLKSEMSLPLALLRIWINYLVLGCSSEFWFVWTPKVWLTIKM